jgi:hypothetical protein
MVELDSIVHDDTKRLSCIVLLSRISSWSHANVQHRVPNPCIHDSLLQCNSQCSNQIQLDETPRWLLALVAYL